MGKIISDNLIVVLADDLTGAADTGVQFLYDNKPAILTAFSEFDTAHLDNPAVLSVYTRSRSLAPRTAAERAGRTAEKLVLLNPALMYKKIDSCMRGNVIEELDAILQVVQAGACFLAPAFPEQGRTTVHSIHYLNEIPVAETEMARDPLTPVHDSDLFHMVSGRSRYGVGRIDIDDYAQGTEYFQKKITSQLARGCRYIVCDAVSQLHLDLVAELGLSFFSDIVFAGSAGLAASVAGILGRGEAGGIDSGNLLEIENIGVLWLCGSASQKTAEQVQLLLASTNCAELVLASEMLAGITTQKQKQLAVDAAQHLQTGSLVIHISPQQADGFSAHPEKVLQGLTRLSRELLSLQQPACLFLSGGDTADAVLQATGVQYIHLDRELVSGVVQGRCCGGLLDKTLVVTKAGSFGTPDILLRVLQKISSRD